MRYGALSVLLIGFAVGCGPDSDEIIKAENQKLSDMAASENVRIEEALNRIRAESELIAKGGTVEVVYPHHIQVGAFTTEAAAIASVSQWETNGFTNATYVENPSRTTIYRYFVRLTGYSGYRSTLAESERINQQYTVKSFPLQVPR